MQDQIKDLYRMYDAAYAALDASGSEADRLAVVALRNTLGAFPILLRIAVRQEQHCA
tara:strand:+ start:104 stop:274 length:171 start_codon:yes stop_codon:yes gene_type:complete